MWLTPNQPYTYIYKEYLYVEIKVKYIASQ